MTITDLVENFKSGTPSCKILISKRLRSGMHLQNGNEAKHKKIKTSPQKMNATEFIFWLLAKSKFRNWIVKFLLVWLNQLTGLHSPLAKLGSLPLKKTKSTERQQSATTKTQAEINVSFAHTGKEIISSRSEEESPGRSS